MSYTAALDFHQSTGLLGGIGEWTSLVSLEVVAVQDVVWSVHSQLAVGLGLLVWRVLQEGGAWRGENRREGWRRCTPSPASSFLACRTNLVAPSFFRWAPLTLLSGCEQTLVHSGQDGGGEG